MFGKSEEKEEALSHSPSPSPCFSSTALLEGSTVGANRRPELCDARHTGTGDGRGAGKATKESARLSDLLMSCVKGCRGEVASFFTVEHLRWPLQVSVATGLVSLVCFILPEAEAYFGSAGTIGCVITVLGIEATAGLTLRRSYALGVGGLLASLAGLGCLAICAARNWQLNTLSDRLLVHFFSVALCIPAGLLRMWFPRYVFPLTLTTAQTVLLSGYSARASGRFPDYGYKRGLTTLIAGACTVLSCQFVLPNKARPQIVRDISIIWDKLADILEPVALSLGCSDEDLKARGIGGPAVAREHHAKVLQSIQQCSKLLDGQNALLEFANNEIRLRKPHRFPATAYRPILDRTRQLFYHIVSLTLVTRLGYDDDDGDVEGGDVAHEETGGRKGCLRRVRWCGRALSGATAQAQSGVLKSQASIGLTKRAESVEVGNSAYHIAQALRDLKEVMSKGAVERVETACEHLHAAAAEMEKMLAKRAEQREMYSRIIQTTFYANATQGWHLPKDSPFLDWELAIEIDPYAFLSLPSKAKLAHWDSYWLKRDQHSVANTTLLTVIDILHRLASLVHEYVLSYPPSADGPFLPLATSFVLSLWKGEGTKEKSIEKQIAASLER